MKICGLRDPETAAETAKAGADLIGMMFAESRRKVTPQQCYDICEAVLATRRTPPPVTYEAPVRGEVRGLSWYGAWSEAIEQSLFRWRPLLVGVFADQKAEEVNDIADAAGLDFVQLSGDESPEFVRKIVRPVDPQHRHLCATEILGRIPLFKPQRGLFRSQFFKARQPGRVLTKITATIDRHSEFETRIHTRHYAGKITAP